MYKHASRSAQSRRDRGLTLTGQKPKNGKRRRRKSKLAKRIDAGVEERRKREWFRYIEKCAETGSIPVDVPEEILKEWQRRNRR